MSKSKSDLFKEFLADNHVLIVDTSGASRNRLAKTLVDLGGKRHQMDMIAHFEEAKSIMENKKPRLVIADYRLKGGSGFDLFRFCREHIKDPDAILILVTSNTSQSAVAKAAEEDVDSFILKPYTVSSLQKSLLKAFMDRVHPSDYAKAIIEGKKLLFEGNDVDGAEKLFKEALNLHPKPSLAHFYLGQVEYIRTSLEEAEKEYKEGLTISKIHYKCQIGLYELFMQEDRFEEAYLVVKNIAKYFPANPVRLREIIRLAIVTRNYVDIEFYYNLFKEFEERDVETVNYICSGMYVLGKFYLINGNKRKAEVTFDNVSISCAGMNKFFRAMISNLVEYEAFEGARNVFKRYDKDESPDYLISQYLAFSEEYDLPKRIAEGLGIYNKGIKDPLCMKILLEALKESGEKDKYNRYLDEAAYHWPELFSSIKGIAA